MKKPKLNQVRIILNHVGRIREAPERCGFAAGSFQRRLTLFACGQYCRETGPQFLPQHNVAEIYRGNFYTQRFHRCRYSVLNLHSDNCAIAQNFVKTAFANCVTNRNLSSRMEIGSNVFNLAYDQSRILDPVFRDHTQLNPSIILGENFLAWYDLNLPAFVQGYNFIAWQNPSVCTCWQDTLKLPISIMYAPTPLMDDGPAKSGSRDDKSYDSHGDSSRDNGAYIHNKNVQG